MSTNYDNLDAEILNLIDSGPHTFRDIEAALRNKLSESESLQPDFFFRIVDRRLQALRKKQAIRPVRSGRSIFWEKELFVGGGGCNPHRTNDRRNENMNTQIRKDSHGWQAETRLPLDGGRHLSITTRKGNSGLRSGVQVYRIENGCKQT